MRRGPQPLQRSPRVALEPGFSLIEVMIATGLIAAVMASLAQVFAVATQANVRAGDITWATLLAAQKIEELRAAPFGDLAGDQSVDYLDSSGNRIDGPAFARRAYTRRWWIVPLPSGPDNTMVITVVVSHYRHSSADPGGTGVPPQEAARLVTLRTRTAP